MAKVIIENGRAYIQHSLHLTTILPVKLGYDDKLYIVASDERYATILLEDTFKPLDTLHCFDGWLNAIAIDDLLAVGIPIDFRDEATQ